MEPLTPAKYCKGCDNTLPSSYFGKDRQRPDGLAFYCRSCKVAHTTTWKQKNPGKLRAQVERAKQKAAHVLI